MASVVSGDPKDGDVLLLVGTRKGAFVLSSDEARKKWRISGPHFTGSDVFHVTHDPRGDGAIFSAVNNPIWGSEVQRSYDLGKTWQSAGEGPAFKKGTEKGSVNRVWHVEPGRASEPNVVYAGVDPCGTVPQRRRWCELDRNYLSHKPLFPPKLAARLRRTLPTQHGARPFQHSAHVGRHLFCRCIWNQ
ncbi:MAG: hypothetical protein O2854_02375 [Chloroflexi bacterium]|nr:hypothetical protein [Chloroflexota bacterium]